MNKGVWLIIISAILYGVITPGAQLFIERGLNSLDISFFRSFIVSIILLPVVITKRQFLPSANAILFFILYGLVGGTLELFMFGSLGLGVPVALVALLLYSQPVWTIFLGKFLLSEDITKRKLISALIGFIGIAVLVKSWEISNIKSLLGILLALGSGFMLSFWVIMGKKSADLKQHYITTTFSWSFFSAIWLFLFYIFWINVFPENKMFIFTYNLIPQNILFLVIFAIFSGLLPHLLFYKGIITVGGSVAGIILLLEPATATVLADIIFSQKIGYELIIGGILILISNYFILKE